MRQSPEMVAVGTQLAAAGALVLTMTVVHGLGLGGISRLLKLGDRRLKEREWDFRGLLRIGSLALLLFLLHVAEMAIFAGFYLAVGALQTLEEALYFSASTYATLGRTEEFFPASWRLLGSLESLIGFLLIGWSAAYIVSRYDKMRS